MSHFRTICAAGLTIGVLSAAAAHAQSVTSSNAAGSSGYLAGLPPPHQVRKAPRAIAARPGAVKTHEAAVNKNNRPVLATSSTARGHTASGGKAYAHAAYGRARLAERINSRVGWPHAESAAPEESSVPHTALEFTTEDTGSKALPTQRRSMNAAAPTTSDRPIDTVPVDTPVTANNPAPIEETESPAQPAIGVAQIEPLVASAKTSPPAASPPVHADVDWPGDGFLTAQTLATLAGVAAAALAGWLIFGAKSQKIRIRRT